MNKMRFLFLTLFVFAFNLLFAGSPFSDVKFYESYLGDEYVQQASERGALDGRLAGYLMDVDVDIDVKAAVINALSWDKDFQNLSTFKQFLGRKYGIDYKTINIDELTADEAFCFGYMSFLSNKSDSEEAAVILEKAKVELSNSYTVNIVLAMAKADMAIENGDWCAAWSTCEKVILDSSLEKDMEFGAIESITSELETVKSKCN